MQKNNYWNDFKKELEELVQSANIQPGDPQLKQKRQELNKNFREAYSRLSQKVEDPEEQKVYKLRFFELFQVNFAPHSLSLLRQELETAEQKFDQEYVKQCQKEAKEQEERQKDRLRKEYRSGTVIKIKSSGGRTILNLQEAQGVSSFSVFDSSLLEGVDEGDEVAVTDFERRDGYLNALSIVKIEDGILPHEEEEVQPKKPKPKEQKPKTQYDKLQVRVKTGLVSEKQTALALFMDSRGEEVINEENILSKDYRCFWILDCIGRSIIEQEGLANTPEERENLDMSRQTLANLAAELKKLKNQYPKRYNSLVKKTTLDCRQIRKWLNKSPQTLPNSLILKLISELYSSYYVRHYKVRTFKDKNLYEQWHDFNRYFDEIAYKETGKLTPRNKEPEYLFIFTFDSAVALDFYLSVRLGFFDLRPKSYYKLSPQAQLIFRSFGWTLNPSDLELNHVCRIAKIKTKNVTRKRQIITQKLEELKTNKYIKDFQPLRDRNGYWWRIFKKKRLPKY